MTPGSVALVPGIFYLDRWLSLFCWDTGFASLCWPYRKIHIALLQASDNTSHHHDQALEESTWWQAQPWYGARLWIRLKTPHICFFLLHCRLQPLPHTGGAKSGLSPQGRDPSCQPVSSPAAERPAPSVMSENLQLLWLTAGLRVKMQTGSQLQTKKQNRGGGAALEAALQLHHTCIWLRVNHTPQQAERLKQRQRWTLRWGIRSEFI